MAKKTTIKKQVRELKKTKDKLTKKVKQAKKSKDPSEYDALVQQITGIVNRVNKLEERLGDNKPGEKPPEKEYRW